MSTTDLKSFGIIITTYSGDFQLTRGLLASIKCYAPDLPICLIKDGDFDIKKECDTYNIIHVIHKKDVQNQFLREICFGSRCTNLIAFLESPFERFIYIDSDTIIWGNLFESILKLSEDFVFNEPHEPYNDQILREQYFDSSLLFEYTESFITLGCHFFNSGIFIAQKNCFERQELLDLIELWSRRRDLLPTDPQSILNVMVFRNNQKGKLSIGETHLQTIVPVWSMEDLRAQFKFKKGQPIIDQPTVIHWAGTKPLLMHRKETYITPMLFYRKKHLKNVRSIWRFVPLPYLYWEEFRVVLNRYYKGSIFSYLKRKVLR